MSKLFLSIRTLIERIESVRAERLDGRLQGITKKLFLTFYPTYRFTGAISGFSNGVGGAGGGMRRGTKVDVEMRKACEDVRNGRAPTVHHPYAQKALKALQALQLKLVDAQVPVFCAATGFKTYIDIVCIDEKGVAVVVELKCGFRGYHDRSSGRMLHEFKTLTNAPKNQHMLQLAITSRMFALTYPGIAFRGLLLRSEERGVEWTNMDENVYKHSMRALNRMQYTPDATDSRPNSKVIKKTRTYVTPKKKKCSNRRTMPVRRRRIVRKK